MTARRRRALRFAGAAAVIALVAALPALVGIRSAPADQPVTAAAVLARIDASTSVGYSGYAQSVGTAGIPDVPDLGDLPSLLGDVTELRVWWTGPSRWRVDQVGDTTENDTYAFPGGSWEWSSGRRAAVEVDAVSPVRLLRPADLTPDQLGRRLAALAAQPGVRVERDGVERIAGRTALGVRLSGGAAATTVADVQLWADAATGVPLAASVTAVGQHTPLLASTFLDFHTGTPKAATDTFTPPPDATVQQVSDASLRGLLGRLEPLPAAASAGGLDLEDSGGLADQQGVALYGRGLAQVAAVGLSRGDADTLIRNLGSAASSQQLAGGRMVSVSTPLVDLALLEVRGFHVLLIGTVPRSTLVAVLADLHAARGPGFR